MTGCWIWAGAKAGNGYGVVRFGPRKENRMVYVHRRSYERNIGPISEGLNVLHKCDTPACFRPSHLFLGTQADNMRDCSIKGRTARGESSGTAKLNSQQVKMIRTMRVAGFFQREIADVFGVSRAHISLVARRKSWKHL